MLPIVRLPLPTPYPVGPVNAYLINARPYTLVDPGPNSEQARELLSSRLAGAGVRPQEIERIIITHGHSDHAGLAAWVKNLSGAAVLAHPSEFRKLTGRFDFWGEADPYLSAGGMPEPVMDYLHSAVDPLPPVNLAPADVSPLRGGERLPAGDDWLEVLHLPGHAVGHLGLFEPGQGDLLAGDFLLPDITPNPIMEPDPACGGKRARSLSQYLASLDRVAALGVRLVWPGHGNPFAGAAAVIGRIKEHHTRRLDHIMSFIGESWLSPFEITGLVYPGLDDFDVYLGFSEVVGHLDLLMEQGRLLRHKDGGVFSFRRAPEER